MLDVCCVLRCMMSTLRWSRPETNVRSQLACCCSVGMLLRSVARKCCSCQVSFLSLARGIHSGARNDTAQTESVLTRLVDTASLDSRLHQSSRGVFPQCYTHNSSWFLGSHFAHDTKMFGLDTVQHGISFATKRSGLHGWDLFNNLKDWL